LLPAPASITESPLSIVCADPDGEGGGDGLLAGPPDGLLVGLPALLLPGPPALLLVVLLNGVGACVIIVVVVSMMLIEEASFTVALESVEPASVLAVIAVARDPLETAPIRYDTTSSTFSTFALGTTKSKDTSDSLVRRAEYSVANRLVTWSMDVTLSMAETSEVFIADCATSSLLKTTGSTELSTTPLETVIAPPDELLVGLLVGMLIVKRIHEPGASAMHG